MVESDAGGDDGDGSCGRYIVSTALSWTVTFYIQSSTLSFP